MCRVLVLTLLATAVTAVRVADPQYRGSCAETPCGRQCCTSFWVLNAATGTCVKTGTSEECALCDGTPLARCKASHDPHPELVDTHGNVVAPVPRSVRARSSGPPSTVPNAGVTLGLFTQNGMEGWLDVPAARFSRFTEFLVGLSATIPSFHTRGPFTVRYTCEKRGFEDAPADFAGCDIFFFVYRCPPCDSLDNDVGAKLLSGATPTWHAHNCGPVFKLDAAGAEHPFAVYSAELADGEAESVELDGAVELMFWAMTGKNVICAARDESACLAAPLNCEWLPDAQLCRQTVCDPLSPYVGPMHPTCTVCVDDESRFTPEVIGA